MKDWKITAKKIVIIALVVLICISIARYCVKNTVIDAAVNEQTGAITFLNRDYELKTYDRFGNLIYDTELFNTRGGYAHLDYEDGLLTVYVLRTEEVRKYDENGNLIDQQNDSEDPPMHGIRGSVTADPFSLKPIHIFTAILTHRYGEVCFSTTRWL